MPETPEVISIDFPACIREEFPDVFECAWSAAQRLKDAVRDVDFSCLEQHSPGLKGFDWSNYLDCSVIRVVRALRMLLQFVPKGARVLDYGAYFGNFALPCGELGYIADAADFYGTYRLTFQRAIESLRQEGIGVLDLDETGPDLSSTVASYDAVLCMGVIEHIAHTPRLLLETLNRVLKPNGTLILDTPNLAYIYKRKQLSRGESVFPDVAVQFGVQPPFEGHHREYTVPEVQWMLNAVGHEILSIETFCYSLYGLKYLQGEDLENYRIMQRDPQSRELILTVSRKTT